MSFNLDEFLQHELYLNRLASGGINSYVYPSLADTYKAIRAILQQQEIIQTPAQLAKVTVAINAAIDANGGWAEMTVESLNELAVYEASWQAQFIGASLAADISTPAEKSIVLAVNKALMSLSSGQKVQAGTWSDFYHANLDSRKRAINGIIMTGYSRGETINQMSRKIRQNIDGVLKRDAETLARTGYQHYANKASDLMIQDNLDILEEYFYVVTFDSRTSDTCISISTKNAKGNRFKTTDPRAPLPPLHFGCRTRRIALAKGAEPTGTRAALGAKESGEEAFELRKERLRTKSQVRYRGKKDKNIFTPEQIKAGTPLDKWLREQPDYYIKDTLGAKKFKLFKEGGLSLKSFSDALGKPLTLNQIIERHPVVAKRVL